MKTETILIVDDSPRNISLLNSALMEEYSVKVATSGIQALKICRTMTVDLVLLDVMMPEMDGFETCRRLQDHPDTQGIPVIFVTARDNLEDESEGFACGAVDYITKPIRAGIVRARVRTHLDLYNQNRALEHLVVERTAQLVQQQKLEGIGTLAGGMAHDINNLLTPIFITAEMAHKQLEADHPVQRKLTLIHQSARRIKDLVSKIMLFSRMHAHEREPLDVNVVIRDFMSILRRTIRENIIFNVSYTDASCIILADRSHLEQVLVNLAVNAQDAISNSGNISITSSTVYLSEHDVAALPGLFPGHHVKVSFSDDGCGMELAVKQKMFEPFFTTKSAGKGTGLGMSTVYGIVKMHAGYIGVESTIGSGTTFSLFFPLYVSDSELAAVTEQDFTNEEALVPANGTVLLVEDNEVLRDCLVESLLNRGYTVLSSGLPREAIELYHQNSAEITALVTDIIMPEMSGHELSSILRESQPGLPVLYITGYAHDPEKFQDFTSKTSALLTKPFAIQDMIDKLLELTTPAL